MPTKQSDTKEWLDPDDAPEWAAEAFERAEIRHGDEVIRPASGTLTKSRGRPKLEDPKKPVSIRLSSTVLDHYRSLGSGWQTKLNADLEALVDKKRA